MRALCGIPWFPARASWFALALWAVGALVCMQAALDVRLGFFDRALNTLLFVNFMVLAAWSAALLRRQRTAP